MTKIKAIGALSASDPLQELSIERRALKDDDVQIQISYCGLCHSDVHIAKNDWTITHYPCVPGHEIVGTVSAVGKAVRDFKVGDVVGVGCMVGSCQQCAECADHLEQYCNHRIDTYNSTCADGSGHTLGGYSQMIVVNERFVLRIRHDVKDLAGVAPLLCAGITTYSPLRHWQVKKGDSVGVVGIGGLGHMAVKLAKAMGAYVAAFTTSAHKKAEILRLGADEVVLSNQPDEMAKQALRLDFILNTVAAPLNLDPYLQCLKRDGTMTLVGAPATPHQSPNVFNLILKRRSIAGSLIGGIQETQEMLDFCAENGITADIECIAPHEVNEAYERMLKGDVQYRFVMDLNRL